MRQQVTLLLVAVQALTRVPVSVPFQAGALGRAVRFFPLVGLGVGSQDAHEHAGVQSRPTPGRAPEEAGQRTEIRQHQVVDDLDVAEVGASL